MASAVLLPQALCVVPRNAPQCAPNKLRSLSAVVSRRPSSIGLRVSLNPSSGISFWKLNDHRSLLLRAEAKSDETEEAEEKPPGKPRINFGNVMEILNKRAIEESDDVRPRPDIRTGDVVEIKMEFPEKWRYRNPAQKHRTDVKDSKKEYKIYKGIVISRQNAGIHTTIRIRRIIAGVGVEIVFPLYSPNIKEIKVVHHRKVRRARLYYLRDKLPRFSTFK